MCEGLTHKNVHDAASRQRCSRRTLDGNAWSAVVYLRIVIDLPVTVLALTAIPATSHRLVMHVTGFVHVSVQPTIRFLLGTW